MKTKSTTMTDQNTYSEATDRLWVSPSLIPVLLMMVKESLAQWERMSSASSGKNALDPIFFQTRAQQINRYQAFCYRWKQATLNERQRQWLQEIEYCLQSVSAVSIGLNCERV